MYDDKPIINQTYVNKSDYNTSNDNNSYCIGNTDNNLKRQIIFENRCYTNIVYLYLLGINPNCSNDLM